MLNLLLVDGFRVVLELLLIFPIHVFEDLLRQRIVMQAVWFWSGIQKVVHASAKFALEVPSE